MERMMGARGSRSRAARGCRGGSGARSRSNASGIVRVGLCVTVVVQAVMTGNGPYGSFRRSRLDVVIVVVAVFCRALPALSISGIAVTVVIVVQAGRRATAFAVAVPALRIRQRLQTPTGARTAVHISATGIIPLFCTQICTVVVAGTRPRGALPCRNLLTHEGRFAGACAIVVIASLTYTIPQTRERAIRWYEALDGRVSITDHWTAVCARFS